jgi:hypothetical protein
MGVCNGTYGSRDECVAREREDYIRRCKVWYGAEGKRERKREA